MHKGSPESAGAGAPETKESMKSRLDALQKKHAKDKREYATTPETDREKRDSLVREMNKNEKEMKKLERELKAMVRGAQRDLNRSEAIGDRHDRMMEPIDKMNTRLSEIAKRLMEIEDQLSQENIVKLDTEQITALNKEQGKLMKEESKIIGTEKREGKYIRKLKGIDRQIYGDFDDDSDSDRVDLIKKAKSKKAEAESALAEIKALQKMELGDDPELDKKIKELEAQLKAAEATIATPPVSAEIDGDPADEAAPDGAADDKGEQVEEGLEDIETNNERMVRITVNLAQYLAVNPPIEGEMLDGEVIQTNLAEFAFIFTLKRAGQDGLKAIQEKLGDDNLQKLKDTMGFVIKEGYDKKTGEPQLVYEFDDNLKDEDVIKKIKEQREGASIKNPKQKAVERSGDEMKKLAKESMKSILTTETLQEEMAMKGIGMDSSLFDYFNGMLAEESEFVDKADAQEKLSSLYQNKYILESVRDSIKGLEGDELNKALDGLGIARDAYQEMAKDELTDDELKTLLISAGMAKEMPMFQGITVGDVVKDLYRNGDESMREKLRTEFAKDEKANKIFDAQDEKEKSDPMKEFVEMVLSSKEKSPAEIRDTVMPTLQKLAARNAFGVPEGSPLKGDQNYLDFGLMKHGMTEELSLSMEEKIDILSRPGSYVMDALLKQFPVDEKSASEFVKVVLTAIQDLTLGDIYNVKPDEYINPKKVDVGSTPSELLDIHTELYGRFTEGVRITDDEYRDYGLKLYKRYYGEQLSRGEHTADTNFIDALSKDIFDSSTEEKRKQVQARIFDGKEYSDASVDEKIDTILYLTRDVASIETEFYKDMLRAMKEITVGDVIN